MRTLAIHTAFATALLSTVSLSAAFAMPVAVPTSGDPFPNGSQVNLSVIGSPVVTPIGDFSSGVISGFNSYTSHASGTTETWTYDHTAPIVLTLDFTSGTAAGLQTIDATADFKVSIFGRTDGQTGSFTAQVTQASFSGVIDGYTVTASLLASPHSTGTITYESTPSNYTVSSTITVHAQGCVGGDCQSIVLSGNSAPQTPIPAALPLFGTVLGIGGLLMRRRKTAIA